jgi:hypothetical protein
MPDSSLDPIAGEVAVQLMDATSGRPIQCWTFQGRAKITIGRSPDQDVSISDPYVSRSHADLVHDDGQWRLIATGRNGVVVANQLVTEYLFHGEVIFRLGMDGPTLRFRTTPDRAEIVSTICFDSLPAPLFLLDEDRVRNDVGSIADGDYFQSLQRRAKEMRRQRESG